MTDTMSTERARGPVDPRVLRLAPALRTHLITASALALFVAAAVLTQAEAISRLLPRMIDGDGSAAAPLAIWLVSVAVVRAVVALIVDRSASITLIATRSTMRRRILDKLAVVRPDQDLGPGDVAALTTTSTDALEPWVRSYLPGLSLAVVVPLAAGLRILGADLISALILAVVVPLIPIFMILIGLATQAQQQKQWDALQRLAARFVDVLTGLPTLRMFGRADAQVERVRAVTERYRKATMSTLRVAFLSALVLELLASLSVALIALSLGIRLTRGDIDLETALVVLLLAPECLLPIRRVAAAFHASTAGVDAAEALDRATSLPERPHGHASVAAGSGPLVARDVSVTDSERGSRLASLDVRVEPGAIVALSGPSGAGKSTMLDVLRGAIFTTTGSVQLGGTDVGDLTMSDRSQAIAWVPQRPRALGATVVASAALGHPDDPRTHAFVTEALAELGLTDVGHLAPTEVSGGERRRLALARALVGVRLGRHRFVLIDEPTAQLDERSATLVIRAIESMAEAGAGLVVATHDDAVLLVANDTVFMSAPTHPRPQPDALAQDRQTAEPPRPLDAVPVPDPVPGWAPDHSPYPDEDLHRGSLRWLMRAARPQRRRLVGSAALGVLTEACAVGLAGTAAWLIVRASEQPSFADLAVAAVGVRAFGVGKGVLRYAERLTSHDTTIRLLADLRAGVVGRLTRLAPTGLPNTGRGDVLGRLVDDIDRLQDLFLRVLGPVIAAVAVASGAALAVGILHAPSGLVLMAATAAIGVVAPYVAYRAARRRGRLTATARGQLLAAVVDLAEHGEELVACGAATEWRNDIEAKARVLDTLDRRQARTSFVLAGAAAAAPALVTAIVVAVVGSADIGLSGTGLSGPVVGVLVLLPLAVVELLAPLAATGDALARVEASATRVRSLLSQPDPVIEPADPAPAPATADLRLTDVSFGWPNGPDQVVGIEAAVPQGSRIVVTGPSGSGKSTVAAGLVRFLEPRSGVYEVGAIDSCALGGDEVRRAVTWCQQEPWFADSTLADNLRVADPSATDEHLWSALAVVHLDAWAHALPRGLETRLARDAEAMSGGERQRLALARALLGGHGAVVLDEPTAHLDRDTARAVLDDLLAATADRAVLVIAHGDIALDIGPEFRLATHVGAPSRWTPPELLDC